MVGALLATERPQASDCMSLSLGFPVCQVALVMWNCGEGEISATAKLGPQKASHPHEYISNYNYYIASLAIFMASPPTFPLGQIFFYGHFSDGETEDLFPFHPSPLP